MSDNIIDKIVKMTVAAKYTLNNFGSYWYFEKPECTLKNHIGISHRILVFCWAGGISHKNWYCSWTIWFLGKPIS